MIEQDDAHSTIDCAEAAARIQRFAADVLRICERAVPRREPRPEEES